MLSFEDKELEKEGTYKKFLLVRQEGKRQVHRNIDHYNLDVIIALGYRVQSPFKIRCTMRCMITNPSKTDNRSAFGTLRSSKNACGK